MAVKNVGSSPLGGVGIEKNKDSDKTKGAVVAELGAVNNPVKLANINNAANKTYGVELSDKARARAAEQKKAFEIAKNTPDVREDKVAELKARIQNGTYEVDSGKIADGMLREALMDHLATNKDS